MISLMVLVEVAVESKFMVLGIFISQKLYARF